MTPSSSPHTTLLDAARSLASCLRPAFAPAALGLFGLATLLPAGAQAQGFVDPRDAFRLDLRIPAPDPFERSVDMDLFGPIMPFGELIALQDGRTAWRPYAPRGWRPYVDGTWDYLPRQGWTWTGQDSWSEITDHSGFWRDDGALGWIWIPGDDGGRTPWEPARVEWRLGDDVIGWAPVSERGAADPRDFIFIPIEGLIAAGPTNLLDRRQSRIAYDRSETLDPFAVDALSPTELAAHLDARVEMARRPEPPYRERGRDERSRGDRPLPYDTSRPRGRFATPVPDQGVAALPRDVPALPEDPFRNATPSPGNRAGSLATLPPVTRGALPPLQPAPAPSPAPVTPPAASVPRAAPPVASAPAQPAAPRVAPQAAPQVATQAPTDASGTQTPAPTTGRSPRVVGPQWLSNGDCSSRGIREGRCKAD